MKSKVNIIIDTNHLFYKFTFAKAYKIHNFLSKHEHARELIQDVVESIKHTINQYKDDLDRVIFVADGNNSWRHDISEEKFYKATRDKKEYPFNFAVFNQTLTNFTTLLHEIGFYVFKKDRVEGDDWIAILSTIFYENGMSSIIMTSDEDARQKNMFGDGKFICVYDYDRNKRIHYVNSENVPYVNHNLNEEFAGIFEMNDEKNMESNRYNMLLDKIWQTSQIIDPNKILFNKILSGDTSDNIPTCYHYKKFKKSDKLVGITENTASKLYDKLSENNKLDSKFFQFIFKDESDRKKFCVDIMKELGIGSPNNDEISVFSDNMFRNMSFIFLNSVVYKTLIPELYNELKLDIQKHISNVSFYKLHTQLIKNGFPNNILKNTDYNKQPSGEIYIDFRNY